MKKDRMKKILRGLTVAGLAATITLGAAGCKSSCGKGSCGGGSCGSKTTMEDKSSCGSGAGDKGSCG